MIKILFIFYMFLNQPNPVSLQTTNQSVNHFPGCLNGPSTRYYGNISLSKKGIPCVTWSRVENSTLTPKDGKQHNHCRNPDHNIQGAWCYTSQSKLQKQFCSITKCPDESLIFWSSYDMYTMQSEIHSTHADAEVVHDWKEEAKRFNHTLILSNLTSDIWSLATDNERKLLYFSDRTLGYIGLINVASKKRKKMFQGVTPAVEGIAYDRMNRNLFWTDSWINSIIVGSDNDNHFSIIYKSYDGSPYALALHCYKRKVIFSEVTFDSVRLYVSDMTGRNLKVLFQTPKIRDVSAITVDYADDRIYFTDNIGTASVLYGSNLDGDKLQEYYRKLGGTFKGLASYTDFLYLGDTRPIVSKKIFSSLNVSYYSMFVISKQARTRMLRYSLKSSPRAIAIMNRRDTKYKEKVIGSCADPSLPRCEHICLPQNNAQRKCVCSFGFQKHGDHQCTAGAVEEESLLVADQGLNRIFAISFSSRNNLGYRVLPASILFEDKVDKVAANFQRGLIYWTNQRKTSLQQSTINISKKQGFSRNIRASSVVIDSCTGNIFFIDSYSQTIYIADYELRHVVSIYRGEASGSELRRIQAIAIDPLNRKVFWTDSKPIPGRGRLMRMSMDGSDREVVLDRLWSPRAIDVSLKRRSLFVGEFEAGTIYEHPLENLPKITSLSSTNVTKQWSLSRGAFSIKTEITDLKVHQNFLYFSNRNENSVKRFDLEIGPTSLQVFGPTQFFSISSLSVFRNSTSHECTQTACGKTVTCQFICADVGAKHLCLDDMDSTHLQDDLQNLPPSYGNTCPDDVTYTTSECHDFVLPSTREPIWSDDHTPSSLLKIVKPIDSLRLTVGRHILTYSATDEQGATTICSFNVRVREVKCNAPYFPPHFNRPNFSCSSLFGSSFTLQCKSRGQVITNQSHLLYLCSSNGFWVPAISYFEIPCSEHNTPKSPATTPQSFTRILASNINASDPWLYSKYANSNPNKKLNTSSSIYFHAKKNPLTVGWRLFIVATFLFFVCIFLFIAFILWRKGNPLLIKISFSKIWKKDEDLISLNPI